MNPKNRTVQHLIVSHAENGQRIDNFLLKVLKGVPKSWVYRIIRRGEVRVNSKRIKPIYRLQLGDTVRIPPLRMSQKAPTKLNSGLIDALEEAVLYEDEVLLILNKPAKIAVHAGSGIKSNIIETLRLSRHANELDLVHRLDRETSGCLLITKTRPTLLALQADWQEGRVKKTYLALLANRWEGGVKQVDAPLERGAMVSGERMVRVSAKGKPAQTTITPVENFADACLVEIDLLTGRTHQIRVHVAHIGHPVLGDSKYGDKLKNQNILKNGESRLWLHAAKLAFRHPSKTENIAIIAPLDAQFEDYIGAFR